MAKLTKTILSAIPPASAASRPCSIPRPRVVLVPGVGLFGLGRSKKDAKVAADLAEAAIATITEAEAVGRFEPLPEADLFDVEYWSLEEAKLGAAKGRTLAGGGGGRI